MTQKEEEELLAAMDEIRRGEFIESKDLVKELRSQLSLELSGSGGLEAESLQ